MPTNHLNETFGLFQSYKIGNWHNSRRFCLIRCIGNEKNGHPGKILVHYIGQGLENDRWRKVSHLDVKTFGTRFAKRYFYRLFLQFFYKKISKKKRKGKLRNKYSMTKILCYYQSKLNSNFHRFYDWNEPPPFTASDIDFDSSTSTSLSIELQSITHPYENSFQKLCGTEVNF